MAPLQHPLAFVHENHRAKPVCARDGGGRSVSSPVIRALAAPEAEAYRIYADFMPRNRPASNLAVDREVPGGAPPHPLPPPSTRAAVGPYQVLRRPSRTRANRQRSERGSRAMASPSRCKTTCMRGRTSSPFAPRIWRSCTFTLGRAFDTRGNAFGESCYGIGTIGAR